MKIARKVLKGRNAGVEEGRLYQFLYQLMRGEAFISVSLTR